MPSMAAGISENACPPALGGSSSSPQSGVPLSALEECHDMSWQGAGDAAELDDARGLVMKTFNDDDGIVTKDEFLRYMRSRGR